MKTRTIRFSLNLRLAAFALLATLMASAAFAQTAAQQPAPKASLIIEQKTVRFDLHGAARSWQLEVTNQPGDLIYSSGVINQPTLTWALADHQEKPLADGLYVYRLKFWDENGEELPAQRGHVIVNRAGSADRIWVTSNNSTGVGSSSELTVVGSPDSTVGGARLPETRAAATRSTAASPETQQAKSPGVINAVGPISGDGLANRIAKFTGAHTIDDSVMTEVGGNIQVGTNSNFARLTAIHTNVRGIYGRSDTAAGIWGQSISAQGVYGFSTNSTGVEGSSINGVGLSGVSSSNYGVYGTTGSASFAGVFGTTAANNGKGLWGRANNGSSAIGVFGESTDGRGVFGDSQTGTGVRGETNSGTGVYGYGNTGRGVYGNSLANHGVFGRSTSNGHAGVYGYNIQPTGIGVMGEAQGGSNQASIGVYGLAGGTGVRGESISGPGVAGYGSYLGASIYGASGAAWAGFFDGDVVVEGNLQVNNNFGARTDHPLDPANKYLNQTFVESSEMMSVQTGNITTDANGEAVVSLPEYFQAMNGDFRYQLTVVGQFAQAIVAQKIEGNVFKIKTDKANVEVSWQVTGLRQGKTRKPTEELKSETERGHYLNPSAFGQPEEKSIKWARSPQMMQKMKVERQSKTSLKQ